MCTKQTLVERVHADRDRGWDNGSGVSWTKDIVPLVDAYDALLTEVETLRGERAAVVAWLDAHLNLEWCDCCGQRGTTISEIANAIERGEHRNNT